jgi:23S rRNA pseudouridine1911/1915/1917 synthase
MKHILDTDLPLIEVLKTLHPESSRRTCQNWIQWGRVLVDDIPITKANAVINKGQSVSLKKKESRQHAFGIPIIYQDRWIIVIDKPAGLLSVPAEKEAPNAFHALKLGLKTQSIFPVHRLDQETSGVLLFTRSKLAEERFNTMFEQHNLEREYRALIEGRMPANTGTWENYLREKENFDVSVTKPELGRCAVTHYEVVRQSKKFSFLRFRLETGRKHQIRVQAAHRGYPIVGDKRYGSLINPFKRVALHAHSLAFNHPFLQKKMSFTSNLPSFLK